MGYYSQQENSQDREDRFLSCLKTKNLDGDHSLRASRPKRKHKRQGQPGPPSSLWE
jgi:hypothetical protein